MPELFPQLRNIPCRTDLFISTDTEEKRAEIVAHCAAWDRGAVEVRLCENRGRDVAPKLITFRDVYARYDIFLHLHTKRSPHGGTPLSSWRHYLVENLIGSPEIARANLFLLEDPKIGIVFPQHLFDLRGILNWGYDYNHARALLARMGVELNKNLVLEFPSGSMFWGRSAAIRKLLDLDLDFSDFPAEAGQIDGTPAHAIERIMLMVAEASGYEWLKVVRRDLYPIPHTVLAVNSADDIAEHRLRVFQPCLARADWSVRPQDLAIIETRPLLAYPSRNQRPRLTLLTPTVNPGQIFGGVATALKLFSELADELGDGFDRRIVTTEADIAPDGYASFPDYRAQPFFQSRDEVRARARRRQRSQRRPARFARRRHLLRDGVVDRQSRARAHRGPADLLRQGAAAHLSHPGRRAVFLWLEQQICARRDGLPQRRKHAGDHQFRRAVRDDDREISFSRCLLHSLSAECADRCGVGASCRASAAS